METRITWTLLLFLAVMACSSDGEAEPDDLPDPVCPSESGDPVPDFVGLSEDEVLELADERDLQAREVGECFPVNLDLHVERVNLEYVDDVVVSAAIH